MININRRNRKSELLTTEEKKQLNNYLQTFPTVVDAAAAINIHRNVLDRVILVGKGSPETIAAIRKKLKAVAAEKV